jgi:hypothetical protein
MAQKNRFSKPVAFNKNNPDDQKILKHVSRRNFSGYVKKLILNDIRQREEEKVQKETKKEVKNDAPKEDIKPTNAAERLEQLKQQQKRHETSSAPQIFINKER